jgi:hypothetical protein
MHPINKRFFVAIASMTGFFLLTTDRYLILKLLCIIFGFYIGGRTET